MISEIYLLYFFIVSISITLYWINYLLNSKISNSYIKSHIIAEIMIVILLLISIFSYYYIKNITIVLISLSMGMLLYASVNTIGEFIDKNNRNMIITLILNIIIILSIILLIINRII